MVDFDTGLALEEITDQLAVRAAGITDHERDDLVQLARRMQMTDRVLPR